MTTYPSRRRQRLPVYDYSAAGCYFITMCIQNRLPLLGTVVGDVMSRSPAGDQVYGLWHEIPDRYPGVVLDTLMVMSDHLHVILWLGEQALSLSDIVHHLKARSTTQYALGVRQSGWPPFHRTFWQRNFHDRVIHRDDELTATRLYIEQNPPLWSLARQ